MGFSKIVSKSAKDTKYSPLVSKEYLGNQPLMLILNESI